MKLFLVLPLLAVALTIVAKDPVATDSAQGAALQAVFKPKANVDIQGTISFKAAKNGTVIVDVDLENLPEEGGPFPYHIHQSPVPSDGNCTGTKAHLNPYNGTAKFTDPADLEVGDLAGRHGNLTLGTQKIEYADEYISLNSLDKAYFGGLSVVIHDHLNNRLTCANITAKDEDSHSLSLASPLASVSSKPSNSAEKMSFGVVAAAAAAAAYIL